MSMHGSSLDKLSPFRYSTWKSIIREVHMLKDRGVDLISHCHIRVGNGLRTQFWNEVWIGDTQLRVMFPRIYALEINKDCTVADKLQFSVTSSLRRSVRGGVESSQLALLQTYIEGTLLSNMEDRWVWDLNGEGVFRVKDVRILLDECFLPKAPTATRWVKYVPIKINVFAWKVFLDRLPTRSNLQHRGVLVSDLLCPLCSSAQEDSSHLFFSCRLATDIVRLVCRWWNLSWTPLGSYADWLNWFNSIRLSSKVKDLLEGVLYITWWSVWMFRNQLLFSSKAPRKDVIFDDIMAAATQNINNTTIRYEKKIKFVEQPIGPAPDPETTNLDTIDKYYESVNLEQEVACLMLSSMSPHLQRTLEKYNAYDMMKKLKTMFEEQAKHELFETVKAFHAHKQEEGQSVSSYILKMKSYLDTLERLSYTMPKELGVSLILNSLNKDYDRFVQNYNMHSIGKTIAELHVMLKLHEKGIPKKAETPVVLAIREGKIHKDKKKP
ncbi:RNA-directed DNA polymerase, eukaryota [Tanacetum coccineum]